MANWHYYNETGEKIGPVQRRDIKRLAELGTITPETMIEDENGRSAPAKKLKSLTFPAKPKNDHIVPSYSPLHSETTPIEQNPFTAAIPVEENPFTATIPVEENPFIATMPKMRQARPSRVAMPGIYKTRWSFWATVVSIVKSLIDFIAFVVRYVLILCVGILTVFVLLWMLITMELIPPPPPELLPKWLPDHIVEIIHPPIGKFLKEHEQYEGNITVVDEDGLTLLHHAASEEKLDIVKFLVWNKEADVNAKSSAGFTPLDMAKENEVIIEYLENNGAVASPKSKPTNTTEGQAETSELQGEHEGDVKAVDKDGLTLSHSAVEMPVIDTPPSATSESAPSIDVPSVPSTNPQIPAELVDLQTEYRKNGFDTDNGGAVSHIALTNFVRYGSAGLRDRLSETQRHNKGVDAVQKEIVEAKAELAQKTFIGEYTFSMSNVDENSFMKISSNFVARSVKAVSFPMQDITGKMTGSDLGGTSAEIRLSVSGSANSIQELTYKNADYRARMRFTNLRYEGGMAKADVLSIEIIPCVQ